MDILIFGIVFVVCLVLWFCLDNPAEEEKMRNQKRDEKYNNYRLVCPVCGARLVKKISTANRAVSVAAVGMASSKIGKQYECDRCGHKW